MNWKQFFLAFLRSTIITIAIAVLLLGLFGFFLAGTEGLFNGALWGLILGIASVPFTGFMILAKYWGDFSGRYGAAWFKKEAEGEEEKNR